MHNRHKNWEGVARPFFSPFAWPRWARIAFAVILPVSGPLWFVGVALGMFGYIAFVILSGIIFLPVMLVIELFEKD